MEVVDSDAPYPPDFLGLGMEVCLTVMTPDAPHPVVMQVRMTMQSVSCLSDGPALESRTQWFVLTPGMARQMAEDLQDAARRAEVLSAPVPPEIH